MSTPSTASKFTIDKSVPMPQFTGRRVYPFPDMEVGDSFFIEGEDNLNRVRWASNTFANRNGVKFSIQKSGAGHRIWRVA